MLRLLISVLLCFGLACQGNPPPGSAAAPPAPAPVHPAEPADPNAIRAILENRCASCHSPGGTASFLNILDHGQLTRPGGKVVPGDPESSRVYVRVSAPSGYMPPPPAEPLPLGEIDAIYAWIKEGAKLWGDEPTEYPFMSVLEERRAMAEDIYRVTENDRNLTRWLTLSHLANGGDTEEVELVRHAVNITTHGFALAPIKGGEAVEADPNGLVLRINLHDYGLSVEEWDELVRDQNYQYYYRAFDEEETGLAFYEDQIAVETECDFRGKYPHFKCKTVPFLRADWFVFEARGDQYYELLLKNKFKSVDEVRRHVLGIDLAREFARENAWRGLIAESGVSLFSRAVDHVEYQVFAGPAVLKGTWHQTYDFAGEAHAQNPFANPFGPKGTFDEVLVTEKVFQNDACEAFFPNAAGQNVYLLGATNPKTKECDLVVEAATNVVFNPHNSGAGHLGKFAGSVTLQQCQFCHNRGVNQYVEAGKPWILSALGGFNNAEANAAKIVFPEQAELNASLAAYTEAFTVALEAVGVPEVVQVSGDKEPIWVSSRHYADTVSVRRLAGELGLSFEETKARLIRAPELTTKLGYGPEGTGRATRQVIEKDFGAIVAELDIGKQVLFGGGGHQACRVFIRNDSNYHQDYSLVFSGGTRYDNQRLSPGGSLSYDVRGASVLSGRFFHSNSTYVRREYDLSECVSRRFARATDGRVYLFEVSR